MNPNDDYVPRQMRRDREYEDAWNSPEVQEWIAGLSPQERKQLEADGHLKPLGWQHGNGMSEHDLAESSLASEEPDIHGAVDEGLSRCGCSSPAESTEKPPELIAVTEADERLMDLLRRLMAEVVSQKNPKLTVECLSIACGLNLVDGDSMQEVARRHGISRAAVSKRVVDIAEKLNLPPSRAMRSKAARKTYRKIQKNLRSRYERTRHRKP
jgi:hypothetical protein